MSETKMKIVKDGKKVRIIVTEYDTSIPNISVIGCFYRFNSDIVYDASFTAKQFSNLLGFEFGKTEIDWE